MYDVTQRFVNDVMKQLSQFALTDLNELDFN